MREPHSSCQPILSFLSLETLAKRREKLDLRFIFEIANGYIKLPRINF